MEIVDLYRFTGRTVVELGRTRDIISPKKSLCLGYPIVVVITATVVIDITVFITIYLSISVYLSGRQVGCSRKDRGNPRDKKYEGH